MLEKSCSKCKEVKPLNEFYKDYKKEGGTYPSCIKCVRYLYKLKSDKIKADKLKSLAYDPSKEKPCKKCREIKSLDNFNAQSGGKDGLQTKCKKCVSENFKLYYTKNRKDLIAKKIKYQKENPEKVKNYKKSPETRKKCLAASKEYNKKYKPKKNEKRRELVKTDPMYALQACLRSRIASYLSKKNHTKTSRTKDMLGCDFEFLKVHLELQFESWMTWENRGLFNGELNFGWDVDHIVPLSSAKSEEDLIKLFHWSNLQPLCSYVNRHIKRGKIQ